MAEPQKSRRNPTFRVWKTSVLYMASREGPNLCYLKGAVQEKIFLFLALKHVQLNRNNK